jgi:hypothetical protein
MDVPSMSVANVWKDRVTLRYVRARLHLRLLHGSHWFITGFTIRADGREESVSRVDALTACALFEGVSTRRDSHLSLEFTQWVSGHVYCDECLRIQRRCVATMKAVPLGTLGPRHVTFTIAIRKSLLA